MALSLEGLINNYVDLEKAKINARLGDTSRQQAAGLGNVPATANPQAKAGALSFGGLSPAVKIGGVVAVVTVLALAVWMLKK